MPYALIISLSLSLFSLVVSIIFRISEKLRLTIPLAYMIIVTIFFRKWASEHETLSVVILFALVAISILSWIIPLVQKIRARWWSKREEKIQEELIAWQLSEIRKRGIHLESFLIDDRGNIIDPNTRKPIITL